jgi:hypothetical protein
LHPFKTSFLAIALLPAGALGADGSSAPAGNAALAALEARAPAEQYNPDFTTRFHRDVFALVDGDTLKTGDDFFRAATLSQGFAIEYRVARIPYELALAACGEGDPNAEKLLAGAWDSLLHSVGRPLRFDFYGMVASNPDSDEFTLEPAPKVIRDLMIDPAAAREAASKASDNPEAQAIVNADQAIRAHWYAMTPDQSKDAVKADHQRNRRIREIVKEGSLHTARDFENASLVMQHSSAFAGYQLAHELAVCSMLLGDKGTGRWLVAATYDRMLLSIAQYQRFGTQGAITLGTQISPELAPTDEAGICDGERVALGCPTLAGKRADSYVYAAEALTEQGKGGEAEAMARDGMARVSKAYPDGSWRTFNAERVLGASLLAEKNYADAEPLLLAAFAGLEKAESTLPRNVRFHIREAAESLDKLYEVTKRPDEVAEWTSRVDAFDRSNPASH